ncbi:MAG: DUF927 domain-containing protein, partial [Myxococcaceae bacterium]
QLQEQANGERIPRVRVFTQQGWSRGLDAFVLGHRIIGSAGRSTCQVEPRLADGLQAKGDENAYRELCVHARSHSAIAELAWAAGYSGPLIRLLGLRSMTLSIWCPSGFGKSAAQSLALSAWGDPEKLRITGDVSEAAIEGHLSMRRDTLTCIDDTQLTRREGLLDKLAYHVGSGIGSARATQTGAPREMKNWLTLAIVSGEKPMFRLGAAGGLQNRTVEVEARPFPDADVARRLHQDLAEHHGYTGPKFVELLLERFIRPNKVGELRALLKDTEDQLSLARDEATSNVALLVVADLLARTLLWGEDKDTARAAALKAGAEVLALARAERKAVGTTVDRAYELFNSFVTENWDCFAATAEHGKIFGRVLTTPEAPGKTVAAVLPTGLKEFLRKHEFNERSFLSDLRDKGLLLLGAEKDRLTRKTSLGTFRARCHWIVLQGDDPEPAGPGAGPVGPAAGTSPGAGNPASLKGNPAPCPGGPVNGRETQTLDSSAVDGGCASSPEGGARDACGVCDLAGTTGTTGTEEEKEGGKPVNPGASTTPEAAPVAVPVLARPGHVPKPFRRPVQVVDSAASVAPAIRLLEGAGLLAVDAWPSATETSEATRMLVVATRQGTAIFDLLKLGEVPAGVREVLGGPAKKVALGVDKLRKAFVDLGVVVNGLVDAQARADVLVVGSSTGHPGTLAGFVRNTLGSDLGDPDPGWSRSASALNPEQVNHAACRAQAILEWDVYVSAWLLLHDRDGLAGAPSEGASA